MPIDIILDTDIATDVDDSLALALVLASPELRLCGVTCAYGDTDLRARYAAKLLALAGRGDVPVMAGTQQPLLSRRPVYWEGHEGSALLAAGEEVEYSREPAVDYLIRMASARPGALHVLAIAPLTNIALALLRQPRLPLAGITLMGGVLRGPGRLDLPIAEHNIVCDPEAAHIVLSSGLPVRMIPLDLTTQVQVTPAGVAHIRAGGTPFQHAIAAQIEAYPRYQQQGYANLHDPLAAASLIDPSLLTMQRARVAVELAGAHTTGAVLAQADDSASTEVGVAVDGPRFERFFTGRLAAAR